jgi:hypothetical protein
MHRCNLTVLAFHRLWYQQAKRLHLYQTSLDRFRLTCFYDLVVDRGEELLVQAQCTPSALAILTECLFRLGCNYTLTLYCMHTVALGSRIQPLHHLVKLELSDCTIELQTRLPHLTSLVLYDASITWEESTLWNPLPELSTIHLFTTDKEKIKENHLLMLLSHPVSIHINCADYPSCKRTRII